MRAIRARYNPYLQTRHRIDQLKQLGHSVDKVRSAQVQADFLKKPLFSGYFYLRFLYRLKTVLPFSVW